MPQMPTPHQSRYVTAYRNASTPTKATPTANHHCTGVLAGSVTVEPMASVTVRRFCWPPMSGAGSNPSAPAFTGVSVATSHSLRHLVVGVPHGGQVARARHGVQLGQQPVVGRLRLPAVHHAVVVAEVAEGDRLVRAGGLAGGEDVAVADLRPAGVARRVGVGER